jgi:hypothetical protein
MYLDEPETPSGAAAETNGDADHAETNGDADQAETNGDADQADTDSDVDQADTNGDADQTDTEMAHAEASSDQSMKLEEQVQPTRNDM